MRGFLRTFFLLATIIVAPVFGRAETLPATAGDTLSGKGLVLADAVRGHAAVLVACFSNEAGESCGEWARVIHGDAALQGIQLYEAAMLERAPAFLRGLIKVGMRKGISAADQDNVVVLTQDEKLWRSYFGVTTDKDAYVVLLDDSGQVRWHGHGAARDLEPQLKSAIP